MPVCTSPNKTLQKYVGIDQSSHMVDESTSTSLPLMAWDEEAIRRDARRLQRVLPRLPEVWQQELQALLDEVFTSGKGGVTPTVLSLSDRFELSRKLESAWLKVSGIGHASENWLVAGYLFFLRSWEPMKPVGGVDVAWLERLAAERSAIGEKIECRHLWFFDKAMEQRGEKSAPVIREYDPTEVPSYEFVWDE